VNAFSANQPKTQQHSNISEDAIIAPDRIKNERPVVRTLDSLALGATLAYQFYTLMGKKLNCSTRVTPTDAKLYVPVSSLQANFSLHWRRRRYRTAHKQARTNGVLRNKKPQKKARVRAAEAN